MYQNCLRLLIKVSENFFKQITETPPPETKIKTKEYLIDLFLEHGLKGSKILKLLPHIKYLYHPHNNLRSNYNIFLLCFILIKVKGIITFCTKLSLIYLYFFVSFRKHLDRFWFSVLYEKYFIIQNVQF